MESYNIKHTVEFAFNKILYDPPKLLKMEKIGFVLIQGSLIVLRTRQKANILYDNGVSHWSLTITYYL